MPKTRNLSPECQPSGVPWLDDRRMRRDCRIADCRPAGLLGGRSDDPSQDMPPAVCRGPSGVGATRWSPLR